MDELQTDKGAHVEPKEQRRMEDALFRSEERFRLFAENAPDVIFRYRFRPTRGFEYVSPSVAAITGYTPEEHYADADLWLKLIHAEDRALFETIINSPEPQNMSVTVRWIRRDGDIVWMEQRNGPVYDETGRVVAVEGIARDITKRKHAEQALQAAEEKYRSIFEHAVEGIFQTTPEGRYITANPALARLLGYDSPEALIEDRTDITTQQYVEPQRRLEFKQLMEEHGVVQGFQYEAYRKDRSKIWLTENVRAVCDADVEVLYYEGFIEDITERSRAAEALRKSEARFRAIFERAEIGIAITNREARVVQVNPALEKMLGYTQEELCRMTFTDFTHPDDVSPNLQLFSEAMASKRARYQLEKRYIRRDGDIVWGLLTASVIEDDSGQPQFTIGMVENITERKRAEEALRESESELRALIAKMTDVILVLDAQGRYLKIAPTNPKLLYRPPSEMIGKLLHEVLPPEQADFFLAKIQESLALRQPLSFEYSLNIEGKEIWFEATITPRDDDAVFWIAHDLTERKLAEEALRESEERLLQSQKMEAIGRLAGGIAHDFNNLLAVITLHSDLLSRKLPADNPIQKGVDEIRKASDRAATLTRQLLAFSRKQMMRPKPIVLNSVISDLSHMLQHLIGEEIELQTTLEPALGYIKADPTQIEHVLFNLAMNARDAMPQGGKLIIKTARVCLNKLEIERSMEILPGEYVMLSVSDTGLGMDEETEARIFEPFFTTKGQGKGIGLGLATVYGIIKQSGGDIAVQSRVGEGTTFKIYLPPMMVERPTAQPDAADSQELSKGTETVLLVEDEEMVRSAAREILELSGYRVLEAGDGIEALEVAAKYEEPIQLLLTDVLMPKLGGRELAERLKSARPHLRVIYMSGYTNENYAIIDEKMFFIEKPLTLEQLTSKVREVLDAPPEN